MGDRSPPSAQEIAEAMDMPLDEAERLLCRLRSAPPDKPPNRFRMYLLEWLVTIAIVGFLAFIFAPVQRTHCGGSPEQSCLVKVKNLSMALRMYSTDYDERLAPATVWQGECLAYHKNPSNWRCPSREELALGYAYNALLSARTLDTIATPSEQPMLFESSLGRRNASDLGASFVVPHNRRGMVGYVDGHAQSVRTCPAADAGLNSNR